MEGKIEESNGKISRNVELDRLARAMMQRIDDPIPEETLHECFTDLSEGRSGSSICAAEFWAFMKRFEERYIPVAGRMPPEARDKWVQEADSSQQGRITYDQFCAWVRGTNVPSN